MKHLVNIGFVLSFLSCNAPAQTTFSVSNNPAIVPTGSEYVRKDAPVRIPRFEKPPTIDGQIDDSVWLDAAAFGDFVQIQPGDNVAPTAPTEVLMGYDSHRLYVAFRAIQDRSSIRASVAARDKIFDDDQVSIYLDTFNDQRQAYVFYFNPLGVQMDGTVSEGRGEDLSVDIVMESRGRLTEDGYAIEIAIPFKSLRYAAGKDKLWGLHLFRNIKSKNNEYDSWMRLDRNVSSSLSQAGHITGLEGIATDRQLELIPSLTLSETGRRTRFTFNGDPAGRYVNDGLRGEFGLTAKLSLTPSITLDLALNPDFAQVDADAPVTTANVRFPIFFPEKRPFFLERIDIFKSGITVVNTRSIIDPDLAAKLTGRRGLNTFGILYASDNGPGNYSKDERQSLLECLKARMIDPRVVCSIERLVDQNADIGILRFKRDLGRENFLGFFATTYNFVNRHNHTASLDGRVRFNPQVVAEFQLVGTNSRRSFYDPDLDRTIYRTGNGFGYRAYAERAGRNLYLTFAAGGRTRDYRADVGFFARADTNYVDTYVSYATDQDATRAIIYKRVYNSSTFNYDWKGRTQFINSTTEGMLGLQRQTSVFLGFQLGYERVFEHDFGRNRTPTRTGAFFGPDPERSAGQKAIRAYLQSTPIKQLYFSFLVIYSSGQLDFDRGAGPDFPRASPAALLNPNNPLDPGPGNKLYISSVVRYQPAAALQTELSFTKTRLVRHDTGLTAFDDNIFSSRTRYQFTRYTFGQLRMDYSSLDRHFRPQVILGWAPNPGTAFYIGYNDDLSYNGYNPFTGGYEPGLRGNGRSFFIKASYLFKKSF